MKNRAARIAAVALILLAFLAVVLPRASGGLGDVDSVMAASVANDIGAESAPQQQVSASWASRDLLEVIAREQVQVRAHETRQTLLMLLGVVGLGLVLFSRRPDAPERGRGGGPDNAGDVPPASPAPHATTSLAPVAQVPPTA